MKVLHKVLYKESKLYLLTEDGYVNVVYECNKVISKRYIFRNANVIQLNDFVFGKFV